MNTQHQWSLDTLYTSTNSTAFSTDFKVFGQLISELNKFTSSEFTSIDNAISKIENYIALVSDISNYYKIGSYLSLRIASNNKDSESIKLYDRFENLASDLTKSFSSFIEFIKKIENFEFLINNADSLSDFKFFLYETYINAKYSLSNNEETIIDKLKINGASSFEKLRDNTVSSMLIDINLHGINKKLPFSEIRNLAYDKDQSVRKTAYESELLAYENVDDTVANCLNAIKGWAITETTMRGYDSILQRTLINSRLSEETFIALITSIKTSLPKLQKYFSHKAKLLGHSNALPFYDLFASYGTADYNFTYEEAISTLIEKFNNFNNETGIFIDNAFKNDWIDAFPRPGKRDGAFCSNIHQIKESRILSNFTGSFSDVSTLAHELGHAFHGECLKNEHYLNSDYPMPIAETASIFFETILLNEYMNTATDDEKITLLDNSISDSLQVLVDIYSRFLFENNFINERKNGILSTEEICNLMLQAQKDAYGEGLDKNYLHKYMWLAKPHYYSCDYNYYNFPYAFGMLFAKGIYNEYEKSDNKLSFFNSYKELLASTGKNTLEDVARKMNFEITKKDFWQTSINTIVEEIDHFIFITSKPFES